MKLVVRRPVNGDYAMCVKAMLIGNRDAQPIANNPKQSVARRDVEGRVWLTPLHACREHNRVPLPFLIVTDRRRITNAICSCAVGSVPGASSILQIEENGSNTGDFLFREFGIDRK